MDALIKQIWLDSKKRYGSIKITKKLLSMGYCISQKRVARRMKILNIHSCVTKKYRPYNPKKQKLDCSNKINLLNQEFSSSKPSTKWVGDITYIYTKNEGWTYLAIVMDLFDLKVIGYCYSKRMTSDIVVNSLKMAVSNRKISDNLIFHSDLGSQYLSNEFETLLNELNIKHSYSKKAYPYDNASMESFNSILKKELVNLIIYDNYEQAKLSLFEFIESWYNNTRIHSTLGYITPNQFYYNYCNSL